MPVIAVVNRKGGSGKSTLAAHMAAWCARQGSSVMLGDVDRQQSARTWLKRRDQSLPAIAPWAVDQKNMLRVPTGISHVVLDTPGGIHGFDLARTTGGNGLRNLRERVEQADAAGCRCKAQTLNLDDAMEWPQRNTKNA